MPEPETMSASSSRGRAPSTFETIVGYLIIFAVIALIGWIIFKPSPPRQIHILTINDTYRIGGLYEGTVGGPARVRALRKKLEEEHGGPILLLHGGDVISPSFIGRMYEGEQMIDVLNLMDGKEGTFDPYMFVVLGNHEFDEDGPVLEARLRESEFTWLGSNVIFKKATKDTPGVSASNLEIAHIETINHILTIGGMKIGIFGLTIESPRIDYVERFEVPLATATTLTRKLKAAGADVVIALTHLERATDRMILEKLCAQGLDLIIGGHEHSYMDIPVKCGTNGPERFVLKADADAATANFVTITLKSSKKVEIGYEKLTLDENGAKVDTDVQIRVNNWRREHEERYCLTEVYDAPQPPDCLDRLAGATNLKLEAEEIKIRSYETNLGDWIADRLLAGYPGQLVIDQSAMDVCETAPRVAFINSGSLRLNQDLNREAADKFPIKLRHFEELFQYDNKLVLLKISGAELLEVAKNAASDWEGNGRWLQVAGFGFRHDGKGNVSETSLLDADGKPSGPELATVKVICAVTSEYLVNPEIGDKKQDGYTMLNLDQVLNDLDPQTISGVNYPRKIKETIRAALEATKTDPIEEDDIEMGRTFCLDPKDKKKVCKRNDSD